MNDNLFLAHDMAQVLLVSLFFLAQIMSIISALTPWTERFKEECPKGINIEYFSMSFAYKKSSKCI